LRIAILNSTNEGFFPRFFRLQSQTIENRGYETHLFSPSNGLNKRTKYKNQTLFGTRLNWFIHYHLYKCLGIQDVFSVFATLHLLRQLEKYKPDVIHMHMVNVWMLNFPLFVNYVNNKHIPLVWTMHDCRAFTGRCAYFDEIGCERWKNGCGSCPQKSLYWPSKIDRSAWQWKFRNKWLNKIKQLHIVTPSQWLAGFVHDSFLKNYPVSVIYNGIDIEKFRLRHVVDSQSNRKVILGVAAIWEYRKGIQFFERLSIDLPSEQYQVVLIGGMSENDRNSLPLSLKTIQSTTNLDELIGWYQRASVFVNPTLADNFPTTNIEALASGTPVVTFQTGGSAESIDETSGVTVTKGDYDGLLQAVIQVSEHPEIYTKENCLKRAKYFSVKQFDKYVDLYECLFR